MSSYIFDCKFLFTFSFSISVMTWPFRISLVYHTICHFITKKERLLLFYIITSSLSSQYSLLCEARYKLGAGGTAPPLLNSTLDADVWSALPPALPQGKSPRYPLDRKNLTLQGIEPGTSSPSIYRLSYPGSATLWERTALSFNTAYSGLLYENYLTMK
jgi:hypothetical protein